MLRRFHPLIAALAALGAVTVTTLTGSPAAAATATTCLEPSAYGTVERDSSYPYNPWLSTTRLRVTAAGTTTANCVSQRGASQYRYEIIVDSTATDPVTLTSGTMTYSGYRTTIPFTSASFTAPQGAGKMQVTIKTYTLYMTAWMYQSSATRTYNINVPGSFDTETAAEAVAACPNTVKPMAHTKWGGCEA